MVDLTNDELNRIGESCHATLAQLASMYVELLRHRAAQAADAERIKMTVMTSVRECLGNPTSDWPHVRDHIETMQMASRIATRAAEQLATAAPSESISPARMAAEMQMVRDLGVHGASAATYTVLVGAVRAAYGITHVQADGKPSIDDVLNVLLAALAAVPSLALAAAAPVTPTRIESALTRLGAEHEPPAGWEQRVIDAAEAVALEYARHAVHAMFDVEIGHRALALDAIAVLDRLITAAKVTP